MFGDIVFETEFFFAWVKVIGFSRLSNNAELS